MCGSDNFKTDGIIHKKIDNYECFHPNTKRWNWYAIDNMQTQYYVIPNGCIEKSYEHRSNWWKQDVFQMNPELYTYFTHMSGMPTVWKELSINLQ